MYQNTQKKLEKDSNTTPMGQLDHPKSCTKFRSRAPILTVEKSQLCGSVLCYPDKFSSNANISRLFREAYRKSLKKGACMT